MPKRKAVPKKAKKWKRQDKIHLFCAFIVMIGAFALGTHSAFLKIRRSHALHLVDASQVCMAHDRLHAHAVKVLVDSRTYYSCSEESTEQLRQDESVRVAKDPISGVKVDKALVLIGASPHREVYYFENEENLRDYFPTHDRN